MSPFEYYFLCWPKIEFLFSGTTFHIPLTVNLQHWTGFYITFTVYGNFQGLFFFFFGGLSFAFRGWIARSPMYFFPCSYMYVSCEIQFFFLVKILLDPRNGSRTTPYWGVGTIPHWIKILPTGQHRYDPRTTFYQNHHKPVNPLIRTYINGWELSGYAEKYPTLIVNDICGTTSEINWNSYFHSNWKVIFMNTFLVTSSSW